MTAEIRVQSDHVSSTFVTDVNITYWLNQSLNSLWEMIGNADPDRYVTEDTISAVTGTKTYALPSDYYKTRYVHLLINGATGDRVTIEPFQMAERNQYKWLQVWGGQSDAAFVRYRIIGSDLAFEPDPGTNTFKHGYMQLFTELASGGDTFDGVAGWEEWAVLDVVRRIFIKEESDIGPVMAEQAEIKDRLNTHMNDRDMGRAPRIQNTRRRAALRRRAY